MVTPDEHMMSAGKQIAKKNERAVSKRTRDLENLEDSDKENNEGMYLLSQEKWLNPILQTRTLTRAMIRVPVAMRR
jgi:hypothetical protein